MAKYLFYTNAEEKAYLAIRKFRDGVVSPLVALFAKIGIKPIQISFLVLLINITAAIFVGFKPFVSAILLFVSQFFDLIDGALARKLGVDDERGSLIDFSFDYIGFFAFCLGLIYFGFTNAFWTSFYVVNYVVLEVLIIALRIYKTEIFYVFKSRLVLYLAFVLVVFFNFPFLDIMLVFLGAYMCFVNAVLYSKLYKCLD